jgi:MFS family permease
VLAAAIIDSLGTGLFLPFGVVYFLSTTRLSLTAVGLGLSVAAALALPAGPLIGPLVDRFGPVRVIVISNIAQMAGFVGYLWVATLWQLIVFALVIAVGQNIFWTANGPMVDLVADPGDRKRWFGMMRALQNGGLGLGGVLASTAVGIGGRQGYHALALVNAVTFLAAALLITHWSRGNASRKSAGRPEPPVRSSPAARGGYRSVLADRAFVVLAAVNFVFVMCAFALTVLLSVYVTRDLHRSAGLAGLLFSLNALLVFGIQTVVTGRTERRRSTDMLILASALWGLSFLLMWGVAAVPAPTVVAGLVATVVCCTAAEVVCMPTVSNLVIVLASAGRQGRYFAVQQFAWSVGRVIAPATFTWLLGQGRQWPWITLTLCCAAASYALTWLRRMLPTGADLPPVARSAQTPTAQGTPTGSGGIRRERSPGGQ